MTVTRSEVHGPPSVSQAGRPSRFTSLITVLVSLAFAGNGVALATVSFALPGMRREWDLAPVMLGTFGAVLSVGQLVGALVVGWLADHWGRRLAFSGTVAVMAIGTGLSGLAPDPRVVLALLFVAGFGFGGVSPVAVSVLGELAPPRVRGQLMAWTQIFWSIGFCVTALGGTALTATLGWRWIFGLGATPLLLAILVWVLTPESPRFLLAHGRRADAEALVRELEVRHGVRLPLPKQQRAAPRAHPLASLTELWGPRFRRRTFTLWVTWLIMMAGFNGPIVLLPVILASTGAGEVLAARTSLIIGLFMIPACFICLALIDRIGRRPLMIGSLGIAGIGGIGMAFASGELPIILSGGALAGGVLAAWPVILGYSAELYPTRMRGTAAGWAAGVSRLGSVGAPLLIGALLATSGGVGLALGLFGILLGLAGLLIAAIGEETSGRTLEELSG